MIRRINVQGTEMFLFTLYDCLADTLFYVHEYNTPDLHDDQ